MRIFVVLLYSWLTLGSYGAAAPRFQHVTEEDGLSHVQIDAVVQDPRGFLWIATYDGLNRYDGHRFRIYKHDPSDTSSVSSNWIETLHVDRKGNLWIGTWNGLDRYDPATDSFVRYANAENGLYQDTVTSICDDFEGRLWIGTHRGLVSYEATTGTFTRYRHDPQNDATLSNDQVRVVFEDSERTLWIGTGSPWESTRDAGGLNVFERASGTFKRYFHDVGDESSLAGNWIRVLYEDRQGTLWIGTWGDGLHYFDRSRGEIVRVRGADYVGESFLPELRETEESQGFVVPEPGFGVTAVLETRDGILWVGVLKVGLIRYDRATGEAEVYGQGEDSLSSNEVWSLYEDRQGTLWISTWSGLDKLAPTVAAFRSHGSGNVRSIYEDRRGTLWTGTDRGLLRRDTSGAGAPPTLRHDEVTAIFEETSGAFWVGTRNGLVAFNPQTGAVRRYRHQAGDPSSLSHDQVSAIHEDRLGRLWVATLGGLNQLEAGRDRFHRYLDSTSGDDLSLVERKSGLDRSVGQIFALHESPDATLWLATAGGLLRFIPGQEHQIRRYRYEPTNPNSLSDLVVRTITPGRGDVLWVGTTKGLNRFDPATESSRRFTVREGLPSNVIQGALTDERGHLWLATDNGLARLDPETEQVRRYDEIDGLPANRFHLGACFASSDGELYFGTASGFVSFLPGEVEEDAIPPEVVITSFRKGSGEAYAGPPLAQGAEIALSYRDLIFSLEFAALDFAKPERNRYAYRLAGLSDEWVDLGSEPRHTFTGLRPGDYTFTVRGANGRGVWNEEGASVRIRIVPPFWETLPFRLTVLVVVAGLAFAASRARIRSLRSRALVQQGLIDELETKNAELGRFTYTVSHDLKSPLVTIKGFLGFLEKDIASGDTQRIRQDLERIGHATDTMDRLLNDLLELSRIGRLIHLPEPVALDEVAREAVSVLAGALDLPKLEIEIETGMPTVQGDRIRLLEVYQNLIENAAKFMGDEPAPRIEIGAEHQDGFVVCYVRDNGRGIDAKFHDKIFGLFERLDADAEGTGIGLALVQRIVEVHGGRVWVESEGEGRGSTFFFTLPLGPAGR